MSKDIRIKITSDTKDLNKAEKEFKSFSKNSEKGVKDLGKSLESTEKQAGLLSQGMNKLGGAIVGAIGVHTISNIVGSLTDMNKELLQTGVMAQGVRKAFNNIIGDEDINELRAAVKGTVSDLDLMQKTVQGVKLGLDVAAMPELFKFAAQTAKDTGQEIDYLVESIVTGIGRKSPLILDNLGISAVQLKEKLNGISVEAASVADVTRAVAEIAKESMQGIDTTTRDTSDAYNQLLATVENVKLQGGEMLINNEALKENIQELTGTLIQSAPVILKFITDWGVGATRIVNNFTKISSTLLDLMDFMATNPLKIAKAIVNPLGVIEDYARDRANAQKSEIQRQEELVKQSRKLWMEAINERDEQLFKLEEKELAGYTIVNKKKIEDDLSRDVAEKHRILTMAKIELDLLKKKEEREKALIEEQKKAEDEILTKRAENSNITITETKQVKSSNLPSMDEVSRGLIAMSAPSLEQIGENLKTSGLYEIGARQQEYYEFKKEMDSNIAKLEIARIEEEKKRQEQYNLLMLNRTTMMLQSITSIHQIWATGSLNMFGKMASTLGAGSSLIGSLIGGPYGAAIGSVIGAGTSALVDIFGQSKSSSSEAESLSSSIDSATTKASSTVSKQADTINYYTTNDVSVGNLVGSDGMNELVSIINNITKRNSMATA